MESTVRNPNRRMEIPGVVEVVEGSGGLPKVRITSPACVGEMYLHGAHITSWAPAGEEEVLFLSRQSRWEDGQDRKSTRLNSSHSGESRMPSSA